MYEWYTTYEPINSNTSSGSIPIANFLLSYGSSYSFPLNNNLNCSEVDILFNSSDVIVAICSCVVDDEDNEADEESWREVREIDGENALQLHDSSVAADILMYFIFLLFIISDGDQFVWGGHYNIVTISWQTPFCNIVSFYVYWTTSELRDLFTEIWCVRREGYHKCCTETSSKKWWVEGTYVPTYARISRPMHTIPTSTLPVVDTGNT